MTRHIQKSGKSKTAARVALQEELRAQRGERTEMLRPESRFREAADIWMGKIRARRADSTADTYDHCLRRQVLPSSASYGCSSATSPSLTPSSPALERARRTVEHEDCTTTERPVYAANTRRQIRAIVSGVLQQAVLHKAIPTNPVRELERIESPKGHRKATPRGLTPEERRLLAYVDTDKAAIRAECPSCHQCRGVLPSSRSTIARRNATFTVEPLKADVQPGGDGPYRYLPARRS